MTITEFGKLMIPALLLASGIMLGALVTLADADEGRVAIPCPEGFENCTGVPVEPEHVPQMVLEQDGCWVWSGDPMERRWQPGRSDAYRAFNDDEDVLCDPADPNFIEWTFEAVWR